MLSARAEGLEGEQGVLVPLRGGTMAVDGQAELAAEQRLRRGTAPSGNARPSQDSLPLSSRGRDQRRWDIFGLGVDLDGQDGGGWVAAKFSPLLCCSSHGSGFLAGGRCQRRILAACLLEAPTIASS